MLAGTAMQAASILSCAGCQWSLSTTTYWLLPPEMSTRQPLVYSLEPAVRQSTSLIVGFAGVVTWILSLPAVTVFPLTVGCTGTLTWNVAVVPLPTLKLSVTVSARSANASFRVQLPTAALPP